MKRCRLQGCGKLVYIEPESGRAHDYCCRTHARHSRGHSSQGQYHAQPIESSQCSFLGCSRPRFRDPVTGALKDFCGRTHAARAKEAADRIAGALEGSNIFSDRGMDEQRRSRTDEITSQGQYSTQPIESSQCSFLGCSRPRFRDPVTGELKDFCGRTHAARAKEAADRIAGALEGSNIFSDRGMDEQRRSRTEEIDLTDSSLPNAASHRHTSTLLRTDAHRFASPGTSFPKVNSDACESPLCPYLIAHGATRHSLFGAIPSFLLRTPFPSDLHPRNTCQPADPPHRRLFPGRRG
jgi:hypothetical protein